MKPSADHNGAAESPVYMVVGAYGDVGCELAARLIERGARVIVVGRDANKLALVADSLGCRYFVADAANFSQMAECFELSRSVYGRLDGVASCVGSLLLKPAHLTTESEWNSVVSANLATAFVLVRNASKAMLDSGGSIVLISSAAAKIGLPNHEAISAAKAGVEGLVRSAAATYARHQIRVNCVAPGMLDTALTRALTSDTRQLEASSSMHPLGRIGSARDIASVIDWLLSSECAWVTGQCMVVDGGLSSIKSLAFQSRSAVIKAAC